MPMENYESFFVGLENLIDSELELHGIWKLLLC